MSLTKDIIETACYGGITYWADMEKSVLDRDKMHLTVVDDRGEEFLIRPTEILSAMQKIITKDASVNNEILGRIRTGIDHNDASGIDAECADVIVQVACFGEIVYG